MSKSVIITRPNYEPTTRYLFRWSEIIKQEALQRNFDIIDLAEKKANKERFVGVLKKKSSIKMFIMLNGHGNSEAVFGHDDEVLVDIENPSILANKLIYARACSSAKILGPSAVAAGALVYIGYDVDFTFFTENDKFSRPSEDKTAALFLESSNYVAIALLKGHTASEANHRSQQKFLRILQHLLSEGPKSVYYYTISFLYLDMIHQVCIGNQLARL